MHMTVFGMKWRVSHHAEADDMVGTIANGLGVTNRAQRRYGVDVGSMS